MSQNPGPDGRVAGPDGRVAGPEGRTPGPYGRIARFVLANQRLVASLLVGLVVLMAAVGLPPAVDPNLLGLLPTREPTVQALKRLNDREGGVSLLTLSFAADDPQALQPWLESTTAALQALDRVDWAAHELDPELTRQIALLQLPPDELAELNHRLRGALALGPALNPMVTQRLMQMGSLRERIEALARAPSLLGGGQGQGKILVRPTHSSHDQPFAVALMDDVEGVLSAQAAPGIRTTWIGGAYRHNVEDYRGIRSDLYQTTFTSLGLVFALIVLSFRSWRATALVFVPLIAGNVVVLGLVSLAFGSLNTYTSFGTAILIGLGLDFAVHLIGRYREFRTEGMPFEASVERAWDLTGPPCLTAALTSAAAFLALAAADFQGFAQLGLLLALGLMVILALMLVALPILLGLLDRQPPPLLGTAAEGVASRSTYRHAPLALGVLLVVTVVIGVRTLPHMAWEFDFSALRRDGLSYAELTEAERALAQDAYTPMIVDLPDAEAIRAAQARVDAAIADGQLPHIRQTLSLSTLLPPDQQARLGVLDELIGLVDHPNLRYLPPPLVKELLPLQGATLRPLGPDDLPPPVRDLLVPREGARMLLIPQGNMWDLREAAALEASVHALLEPGTVAGDYVTLGALYRVIHRDMPVVSGLALVLVLVLIAIDLRRVSLVLIAAGTMAAGLVWAAFAVDAVGVKLSIVNVVGVPILVGLGVDVVIHLSHRLRDEGPGGVRRALRTTGVAVAITTITTMASFASLTVAGNRGVRSLGLLVVFGLGAVTLAGAIILPLAWAAGWRLTGRAPGEAAREPVAIE